jgi:hypothetical protein
MEGPNGSWRLSGSDLNARQLVPVRCEARRSEFPPKAPGLAFACRAEADRATAEAGIELIDRTHAPDRPRVVGLIEQAALHTARWRQIEKRDARLLVAIPRLENDAECRHRCGDELAGVVLPLLRFEAVGFNPDRKARRCEVLTAHLFGGSRGIDGDCLFKPAPCFYRLPKRARGDQAFPIRGDFLEADTSDASKFQHHAFEDDAEGLTDQPMISVTQFERCGDADCIQARRQAAGNAPEICQFEPGQRLALQKV